MLKQLMTLTALLAMTGTPLGAKASPVIVEYFTSQGCSSCPPADVYAAELSKRSDVLPLAYHVDYWDYIGWKDTLGSPAFTARQRSYSDALNLRGVYTPQMVVDGRLEGVGSHRSEINAMIETRQKNAEQVALSVDERDGHRTLRLAASRQSQGSPATVWLVSYTKSTNVTISRGENRGRTITYVNAVSGIQKLGTWTGKALKIDLPQKSGDENHGSVALLQTSGNGPIIGSLSLN